MSVPICSACGKDSHFGDLCKACSALKIRGYNMETEDISGAKRFLAMDAAHFYEGYRSACREILTEQMRKHNPM